MELLLKDEAYAIVGAAMDVSNELGCGFLEGVYQEALAIELAARRVPFVEQQRLRITYRDRLLTKNYIADLICFERIIVEIKALNTIGPIEEAQLLNYLKAAALPLGLILNFGAPRLQWRRYARSHSIRVHSRSFADTPV